MAFNQGIDFRSTAGFVTDPANTDVETSTAANYPRTSAQGNTVGWEQVIAGVRNRSAAIDARIAGIAFVANTGTANYRIDLPSTGWYKITLALGDATTGQVQTVSVLDTTTVVSNVILAKTSTAAEFYDACGVEYTNAAWPSSNVSFVANFTSTICRIRLGGAGSGNSSIAHVRVEAASATNPTFPAGIDFRNSSDFVTDPAGNSPEITTSVNYPHITQQNLTVGWEQAPASEANRSTGIDTRLAGIHSILNSGTANYRVDLPAAGGYRVGLALGDNTTGQVQTAHLFDGASDLGTIVSAATTTAGQFYDATGVKRTSAADWVSNNVLTTIVFSTQILRLQLGGVGSGSSTVAHIRVEQQVSGSISQTAKARIQVTGTKTQAAKARIRNSLTKNQTSIAHISTASSTVTKAQTATARIGTGPVTLTTSGVFVFVAGDVNYWPTVTAIGIYSFQGDAPTVSFSQIPSGVFLFKADPPISGGPVQPVTSGQFVFTGDPLRVSGIVQPLSGKLIFTSDPPVIYPLTSASGKYILGSDGVTLFPTVGVSGRFIFKGDVPNILASPIISSGVYILTADAASFANASIVLHESGIFLLRSDTPTVIPLTEPPPPPPPPPPGGINLHVSVSV